MKSGRQSRLNNERMPKRIANTSTRIDLKQSNEHLESTSFPLRFEIIIVTISNTVHSKKKKEKENQSDRIREENTEWTRVNSWILALILTNLDSF